VVRRKFAELLGKLAMGRGGRVVEGTRLLIASARLRRMTTDHLALNCLAFSRIEITSDYVVAAPTRHE
jgi:hypothetical protein